MRAPNVPPTSCFWGGSYSARWDLSPEKTGANERENQLFWTQAYRNLRRAKEKVARRYDLKRKPHRYQVGDTAVYRLNLISSKGQNNSAKLLLLWSKPLIIAKFVKPNVVLLANPDTGVIVRRAHVSQLKAYTKRHCPAVY